MKTYYDTSDGRIKSLDVVIEFKKRISEKNVKEINKELINVAFDDE